jgi:hypothetical protein
MGFGDNIVFFLNQYLKIKKKDYHVFKFCKQIDQPIMFLFDKKKILKPLISIPFINYYNIISEVKKSKFFKASITPSEWNTILAIKNKDTLKNLIKLKLKKEVPSKKMKYFLEKKLSYICFHIKFNFNKNDISGSNARGTSDLDKIFSLIHYLILKNYALLILGVNSDPSIRIIKEYISKTNLEKKVFFLLDNSVDYNFIDQLLSAEYSHGYLGNGAGCVEIFYFLKKKSLIFDHILSDHLLLESNKKYRKTLFKKCIINNQKNVLTENIQVNFNNIEVIENSIDEITKQIDSYLLN